MSRRDKIRLDPSEIDKFLAETKTIILCSAGPDGVPHPMPMWFTREDDVTICMTTYGKSQKIANIRREPRVSLLVESGLEYAELRGVVFYGNADLVEDTEAVIDTLLRASGQGERTDAAVRDAMRGQAEKRVVIRVKPDEVVSWDHGKLGGVY